MATLAAILYFVFYETNAKPKATTGRKGGHARRVSNIFQSDRIHLRVNVVVTRVGHVLLSYACSHISRIDLREEKLGKTRDSPHGGRALE